MTEWQFLRFILAKRRQTVLKFDSLLCFSGELCVFLELAHEAVGRYLMPNHKTLLRLITHHILFGFVEGTVFRPTFNPLLPLFS